MTSLSSTDLKSLKSKITRSNTYFMRYTYWTPVYFSLFLWIFMDRIKWINRGYSTLVINRGYSNLVINRGYPTHVINRGYSTLVIAHDLHSPRWRRIVPCDITQISGQSDVIPSLYVTQICCSCSSCSSGHGQVHHSVRVAERHEREMGSGEMRGGVVITVGTGCCGSCVPVHPASEQGGRFLEVDVRQVATMDASSRSNSGSRPASVSTHLECLLCVGWFKSRRNQWIHEEYLKQIKDHQSQKVVNKSDYPRILYLCLRLDKLPISRVF